MSHFYCKKCREIDDEVYSLSQKIQELILKKKECDENEVKKTAKPKLCIPSDVESVIEQTIEKTPDPPQEETKSAPVESLDDRLRDKFIIKPEKTTNDTLDEFKEVFALDNSSEPQKFSKYLYSRAKKEEICGRRFTTTGPKNGMICCKPATQIENGMYRCSANMCIKSVSSEVSGEMIIQKLLDEGLSEQYFKKYFKGDDRGIMVSVDKVLNFIRDNSDKVKENKKIVTYTTTDDQISIVIGDEIPTIVVRNDGKSKRLIGQIDNSDISFPENSREDFKINITDSFEKIKNVDDENVLKILSSNGIAV